MKMSLQTHYSRNITGQIPYQACNPLPGPPQQNGSALLSQTQNPSIPHNALNRNPDFLKSRRYMQGKIFEILMRRRRHSPELSSKNMVDIAKRLDEGLFRTALSKDEYLNVTTLEKRLLALIKCPPMKEDNRQFSRSSSSIPIGVMIPTPGLSQTSNSTLMSISVDSSVVSSNGFNKIVSSTFNNRSFFPTGNGPSGNAHCGSLNSYDGPLAGVCQQPNAFSIDSGGINMVSAGIQKIRSQMIPTPGFSDPNHDGLNDKAINHCPVNLKSSNNVSMFPIVETSIASQPAQQKPQVGGQNSRTRNIGGHMGSGIRSTFDQMFNGLSNGPISGGMGIIENNISLTNGVGTSEHYLTGTAYDNSTQPLHDHFGHHHPIMQGDAYEISTADALRSGNFYVPITSVGSMTNNESLNATSSQSMPKINSHLMTTLPSIHFTHQMTKVKTESIDELKTSNYISRERQFKNQQRWLLFLLHARRCSAPVGKCQESNCIKAQKLLAHLDCCNAIKCQFPRCDGTKELLNHHRDCQNASCPVCIPVKKFQVGQRKAVACSDLRSGLLCTVNGSSNTCDATEITGRSVLKTSSVIAKYSEDLEPSCKHRKTERTSPFFVSEGVRSPSLFTDVRNEHPLQDAEQCDSSHIPVKSESSEVRVENHGSARQPNHETVKTKIDNLDDTSARRLVTDHDISSNPSGFGVLDIMQIEKEINQPKPEKISLDTASKSGKPKINGVSLTELFTSEQIQQHIKGLRQWVGQSKAKAEKNQAMRHSMNENSCQLCAVEKLNFEPPNLYCTPCGAQIKRNAMYYTFGAGDTRHYFCMRCYNESRGDTIAVDIISIPKARVEKKKNDDEIEEAWVQCDKCEAWQHQICALFNGKRNDGGQAEYTCPNCYIVEVERGERIPLPQSAVLGAKDLPKTILSDHIEQRLFSRLKHERQERASRQGKAYDEVPGAEALVVRVVSSVDKKVEVKQQFSENFREQNYPTEFPYKSKVILLFQSIEGVEVCLFGMYVQEYGSECQQPNHRRVYLAYLDSVKYFRPDIRTVTGEALRTFVYHEILIGYLDYCKKRGFTSCYIWACPPIKGEDYILYCHPEIQKTPKSDKLREWYLNMLKKAISENIVVGLTNMYDHFFVCTGESKAKVTAARLPYFDGDYWPGLAEDIVYQLRQEDDGIKQDRKGFLKKTRTKRALMASGQTDISSNASKDLLLLHKLGGTISPMKEDFIMVHLQHACTHCGILMVSGNRWVCKQCKKFQLCDMCFDAEQKLEDTERHPVNHKDRHDLHPVQITGVPDDTKDKDDILVSEFFDTRQAFLNLCQGNHYQYDTLRRAKHSSMMILYHLHNPTAPAFLATCCVCRLDIEGGQGWHCETCPDYEICNTCYQKGGIDHPHKLTNNPSNDRDMQNAGAMVSRVKQLRKLLDLLEHASKCRFPNCQYPNCRGVKGLFLHARKCKKRAVGGCVPCRRMWRILRIHSQACKESECRVPRCRDLRLHMSRVQQQSESRRRDAVMEMMRQRAV